MKSNPNKTLSKADLYNPEIASVIDSIQMFMLEMKEKGLRYTTWVGTFGDDHVPTTILNKGENYQPYEWSVDDKNIPWFTLWEYCWTLANSGLMDATEPQNVLELGGAASAFSMFIASLGHHITVVERRPTINTANENAKALRFSNNFNGIRGDVTDIGELLKGKIFDHIISISHLFLVTEEARKTVIATIPTITKVGSKISFSFDYKNPNPVRYVDDPIEHFTIEGFEVIPKGAKFVDTRERHHFFYPNPSKGYYTCGTLFMERIR